MTKEIKQNLMRSKLVVSDSEFINLKDYRLGSELCDLAGVATSTMWSWYSPVNDTKSKRVVPMIVGGKRLYNKAFFELMKPDSRDRFLRVWDKATDLENKLPPKVFNNILGFTYHSLYERYKRNPNIFERTFIKGCWWYTVPKELIPYLEKGKTINVMRSNEFKNDNEYEDIIVINDIKYGIW